MGYQSSYKINDFTLNTKNEIERLEAQVDLFWEKELFLYKMFGLEDGMAVVECGCGTGIVGRKLLQAFPESRITAFDIDPVLVETAKNNARSLGLENYEIFELPIMKTGLPGDTYDFAITRLVLEHLSHPADAVKEVFRILKPSGKAVFIDNDFEFHLRTWPDLPELKNLYDAYCRARQDDGGNPKIGRELPNLLKRVGFSNIDLQILGAHNALVGDSIFLKSEGSGIPAKLVKDGYLSGEIYTKIAEKWNKLLKLEGHSLFRQLFFCIGVKPLQVSILPELAAEWSDWVGSDIAGQPKKATRKTELQNPFASTEEKIAHIWSHVLDRDQIGFDENFFEAGGSSLFALEIVDLLQKEFQKKLAITDLFENPTISLLAKRFEQDPRQTPDLTPEQREAARIYKIKERRDSIKRIQGKRNVE